MKSLLLLMCCLGVMAEIRATHVVGTSQDPVLFSHLPDESNFQASGGAALGSFGGFTRVIVLLVVFLGVIYHGFVPTVLLGVEPRPATASLPVRKLSDRDENVLTAVLQSSGPESKVTPPEIRTEVTQKINKQAAKKLAKKAAKKLVEAVKAEEKKAPVKDVVVEKEKKNQENKTVATKKEEVEDVVGVQEAETVGVDSTQDNIFTTPFQVIAKEQAQEVEKEEQVQKLPQDKEQQEKEDDMSLKEHVEPTQEEACEEACEEAREEAHEEVREEAHEEACEEVREEAREEAREEVREEACEEEINKGWVLNSSRVHERTSATIKRVKKVLSAQQLLSVSQDHASAEVEDDLDYDSFIVDPCTVNCPEFLKLATAPILLEDASPLEIAEQETPASIQPVRDKFKSPLLVPEFIPMNHGFEPAPAQVEDTGSCFNSHKKTAWVQRQNKLAWPADTLPDLVQMAQLPWSPIRTPCKFAAGCKKPGCQFTHPANVVPAWLSVPVL